MRSKICCLIMLVGMLVSGLSSAGTAQESRTNDRDARMEQLEWMVEELREQVRILREERAAEKAQDAEVRRQLEHVADRVEEVAESTRSEQELGLGQLEFGGYGEMHANFNQGSREDKFDIHRLVLYVGYEFSDWIRFHSETEIEHAFTSADSGGEVSLEQAHIDFLISDQFNVRVGRILTPMGIVNWKHEPPSFNGVERPSFAKYIIPTTWSSDGIGMFGSLSPSWKYEAYVVGGLDGSKFDAINGIRKGRIKERPSLHETAFTGRLDYSPFVAHPVGLGQTLRLGMSGYTGGLDNGNSGRNPGIDADIQMLSADFEYTISRFDFRGVVARTWIDGADDITARAWINGTYKRGNAPAEGMFGWYLESAYHFWPDTWKKGKLAKSDAVVFLRYDDYDTQYKMPPYTMANPKGDRDEWTAGVNFYLTSSLVLKADYQIRHDASRHDPGDRFNLGVGMQF